jgi:hypothetical protein
VLEIADSAAPSKPKAIWRRRTAAAAACVLGIGGMTIAAGSPAQAVTGPIACPSTACHAVGSGLGSTAGIALDGQGNAYATNPDGTLRKVVLATGATTVVARGLGNLRGLALDGLGDAYTVEFGGTLHQVNLATGAAQIRATGLGSDAQGVAAANGQVFVSNGGGQLFEVDKGKAPRLVASGLGVALAIGLDGKGNAFNVDPGSGQVDKTNLATGAVTTVSRAFGIPTGLAVDGAHNRVYVFEMDTLSRLDLSTGQVKVVATVPPSGYTVALDASGNGYIDDDASGSGALWKINGLTSLG